MNLQGNHVDQRVNVSSEQEIKKVLNQMGMFSRQDHLDIMFSNLLSNAVKYNREGGRVEVLLQQRDGAVEMVVRDTKSLLV
jgi:signal transduction histidine kinase